MLNLDEIRKTLADVVDIVGLPSPRSIEPNCARQPIDFHSVQESTQQFAAACSRCDCEQLSLQGRLLRDCASEMDANRNAGSDLKFFIQLESTMIHIENNLAPIASARVWWTGQRLAEVTRYIQRFLDTESESQWKAFAEKLCYVRAIRCGMAELRGFLALPVSGKVGGFDQFMEMLNAVEQRLKPDVAAEICAQLWCARPKLDCQLQNLWYQTHGANLVHFISPDSQMWSQSDIGILEAYACVWNDLLEKPRAFVTAATCRAAAEKARVTSGNMGLNDVAELLSDPECLAHYGLANILPPAPATWRLSNLAEIEAFLKNELSRWYLRPYRFELQPLDLIAAVVRAQRPLFYHKLLAHALLQFHVLQTSLSGDLEAGYFDVMVTLARNIDILLRGYHLRIESIPKLESADGWAEYLDSLVQLHCGNPSTMGATPLSENVRKIVDSGILQ